MKKLLLGFIIGTAVGLAAQQLDVQSVPAIINANKYIRLNLVAGDRLVVSLNPIQNPGGTILVDHTIGAGKTFSGEMRISGTIQ